MRPDTQEALVMLEAQEVKGAPRRGPVKPSCAARPCSEAFTSSGDSGSRRGGARAPVPRLGATEGQEEGTGGSGKDPIAFWSLCQKQPRDLPCLPGLLPPLPTHPPPSQTWPPRPGAASVSQPLRDRAAQTSPLAQQHRPFLLHCPGRGKDRVVAVPSTRGEDIGTP